MSRSSAALISSSSSQTVRGAGPKRIGFLRGRPPWITTEPPGGDEEPEPESAGAEIMRAILFPLSVARILPDSAKRYVLIAVQSPP